MARRAFVVGAGMTKFERPMTRSWDYPDMGREAGKEALADAKIDYKSVQAVVASYCYGEPTCGQRAVYELGLTGVPVFNVNNNCSSGSSALMLARHLVQAGMDCVMAIGFEKMERGLSERYNDKVSPVGRHMDHLETLGAKPGPIKPGFNNMTSDIIKMFAYAGREYCQQYPNAKYEDFVNIAAKNRVHGTQNPKAAITKATTAENIGDKNKMLCYPITQGMSAMTADGGAAVVVCSQDFVTKNHLEGRAVEIAAQRMVTDLESSFGRTYKDLCGYSMAQEAARQVYQDAGVSAHDVDVIEVHDCFSCNELLMYEALGLVAEGRGPELFNGGRWVQNAGGGKVYKMGDRWVVNPSGGLVSKGHPIGATGLAQCYELVHQLRGDAGRRQVDGARVALQHNFGIGGAAVVTLYKKPSDLSLSPHVTSKL